MQYCHYEVQFEFTNFTFSTKTSISNARPERRMKIEGHGTAQTTVMLFGEANEQNHLHDMPKTLSKRIKNKGSVSHDKSGCSHKYPCISQASSIRCYGRWLTYLGIKSFHFPFLHISVLVHLQVEIPSLVHMVKRTDNFFLPLLFYCCHL